VLALVAWVYGWATERAWFKGIGWVLGWTLLAWTALRLPNGGGAFLMIFVAFLALNVLVPALRKLWVMPPKSESAPSPAEGGAAAAATSLLVGGLIWLTAGAGEARSADFQSAVSQISNL